jgi:hypothetical protein
MKYLGTLLLTGVVLLPLSAVANDFGNRDTLRLATPVVDGGEYRVPVAVHNDQELAGMDIPLRFGQPGDPITLTRVEWSARVAGWDYKHAAIDNGSKTLIIGLISNISGNRTGMGLGPFTEGDAAIATLVFSVQGDYKPAFSTFTTQEPGHALTFLYNRYENGVPYVEEFTPVFDASEIDK